jgi:hypothetical protein
MTYNPSTATLTTTTFAGNSSTTTKLATARAINTVDFDGSAAITVPSIWNYTAKTGTYSAVIDDFVNCTANTFTVTLPTAVGVGGRSIKVRNAGTGVITINTTSSQTIDGAASGARTLSQQYESIVVTSDGANWMLEDHSYPRAWTTYTATLNNFGSATLTYSKWRRVGDALEIELIFFRHTFSRIRVLHNTYDMDFD